MKSCAVVIPFYRPSLSQWERVSYLRTVELLSEFDLFAIEPENSNLHDRQTFRDSKVRKVEFQPAYFRSIEGYNNLMLSTEFYRAFADYEFILIVQLDAMILSSDLNQFLRGDSDYFGAPWVGFDIMKIEKLVPYLPWYRKISIVNKALLQLNFWYVGNGGVSLRRVSTSLKVLERNSSTGQYDLQRLPINEDNFWSFCAHKICSEFTVAPLAEALKFAFETSPRKSFALNNSQLPFACHAFEKHDCNFWLEHFKTLGIDAPKKESF